MGDAMSLLTLIDDLSTGHKFEYDPDEHIYRIDGNIVPNPTTVFKSLGLIDLSHAIKQGKNLGTAVHAACHYQDENDLEITECDSRLRPYVEAWCKFKDEMRFVPHLIEKQCYSLTYRFGCTPDRYGFLAENTPAVVEIKTTQPQDYVALQLVAQAIALAEFKPVPSLAKLDSNDNSASFLNRYCVWLRSDGTYKVDPYKDFEYDKQAWLAALTLYRWKGDEQ
jgi:hypothetical protein